MNTQYSALAPWADRQRHPPGWIATPSIVQTGSKGFILLAVLALVIELAALRAQGVERVFALGGSNVVLTEVTERVGTRFAAMRFSPAEQVWNLEVCLTNKSALVVRPPLVAIVDDYSGTTGPVEPDGLNGSNPPKAFYDFSALVAGGSLWPGEKTSVRMLTLGYNGGAPNLRLQVFALVTPSDPALAVVRTLNEVGHPLPGVTIIESGPQGAVTNRSDPDFAQATLGQTAGEHTWRFEASGYLPVWRREALRAGEVTVLFNPQLVRRASPVAIPLAGTTLQTSESPSPDPSRPGVTRVQIPAGAFAQNVTASLTPLTGQTLPSRLPLGWSPLQGFSLELSAEPGLPLNATLELGATLNPGETIALARWDPVAFQWQVLQLLTAGPTGTLAATLPGSGAYAAVAGDTGELAPPNPVATQPLRSSSAAPPAYTNLSGGGQVQPQVSLASRNAEAVTARADVVITNRTGRVASGVLMRCELEETYRLHDDSRRATPRYEQFLIGYQRPGDGDAATLQASFPMQPRLLLGAEELAEGLVTAEVLPPGTFSGRILDGAGGEVPAEGITLSVAPGDLGSRTAVQLRKVAGTNLVFPGYTILCAFDLSVGAVTPGRRLRVALSPAPANSLIVVAKVIAAPDQFGLEPLERLLTDAGGRPTSLEPAVGERLPGITGPGQYVFLRLNAPQNLIAGLARNAAGVAASGLPVRVTGHPWLTFSGSNGAYRLLAPGGTATLKITDPVSGDLGETSVEVLPGQTSTMNLAATPSGPRVISTNPTNGAVQVPRVTSIVINFSEAINPGSLGVNGIQLLGSNGVPVPASFTLNLRNTTATLIPTAQLLPSATHTVVLSTNIADPTGQRLEGQTRFNFTTESDVLDRLVAQVISYEPTNGFAAMSGSPGTAEPNSAVILVNETSGQTATILSKPDGSFSNSIPADVDDFLSAVLVNKNGTRNTIPVSRQLFRDGSVGLFNGGGILEAQSDGGPVQILIEPGAIPNKTTFKVETIPLVDLLNYVRNTPPTNAHLVTGFKVKTSGDPLSQPMDFSVAVATNGLGLPPGTSPDQAGFALAVPRDIDGVIAYEVVDRMHYEAGQLVTHSPPFAGYLGGQDFLAVLSVPLVHASISGRVLASESGSSPNPVVSGVASGALVSLDPNGIVSAGRPGRLQPGTTYARANASGFYAFLVPYDPFRPTNGVFTLFATHPQYPNQRARKVVALPSTALGSLLTGNILSPVNLYFEVVQPGTSADASPPELSLAHSPDVPPVGTNAFASVRVLAADNAGQIAAINLDFDSALSLVGGVNVVATDVVIVRSNQVPVGAFGQRDSFGVSCRLPAVVVLRASAVDSAGNRQEQRYSIRFGGADPSASNPLSPSDPNDRTGPTVIASDPQQGATGFMPGSPIKLTFSEPINRAILQDLSPIQTASSSQPPAPALQRPVIRLSDNQRELTLTFYDLQPGVPYTLTLTSGIKDLAGNRLDQDPRTDDNDSYVLTFKTASIQAGAFAGTASGGGSVSKGIYSYVLDRAGAQDGSLGVYDLSKPTLPVRVAQLNLPSYPRDLVLIPNYAYKRKSTDAFAVTNDLLAVAGGLVTGGEAGGQFLWVIDISDPLNPQMIATTLLTLATDSAVTKLAWSPPELGYLELSSGFSLVGLINLQTFLLGASIGANELNALPPFGTPGVDQNADGDFVDPGDRLPALGRANGGSFIGMDPPVPVADTDQPINDFALADRGRFVGVVLGKGSVRGPNGNPTATVAERSYRTLLQAGIPSERVSASYEFMDGTPTRVSIFRGVRISTTNQVNAHDVAVVSVKADAGGTNWLAILDITDSGRPRLLNRIPIAARHGDGIYSVIQREDGKLLLATSQDLLVLDPVRFGENPRQIDGVPHPSIVGVIPGAGSGARSFFASVSGLVGTGLGGRNVVFETAPDLSFVFAPGVTPFDPRTLTNASDATLAARLAAFNPVLELGPSRLRAVADVAASTLSPPSPLTHYYVLVHAPGSAGTTIDLALESLNWAGYPLRKKGFLFPPVHSMGTNGLSLLGQLPGEHDSPVASARAWRLSPNSTSPFYNVYLSKPIALVGEEMSIPELTTVKAALDREILWSGNYLRVSLDPSMAANPVLGAFASVADAAEGVLRQGAGISAVSLPADYIMGPNPGPIRGGATISGTLDTVGAHNGEFTLQSTDISLPGRRLPLTFARTARGQALYDGPLGRNWDHYFNQRIVELRETLVLPGTKLPVVVRSSPGDSEIAESKDLLLFNGAGRTMIYKSAGTNLPAEFLHDPLVAALGWKEPSKVARYYRTPSGLFNMVVKFHGGEFARLEPDGMQFWYNPAGRLIKIYDRYESNSLELVYDSRGELSQVKDELRRTLNIGYWRPETSPGRSATDLTTDNLAALGKIARLQDYSGRDVLFSYDQNGRLLQVAGPDVRTVSPENQADAFTGRYKTTYLYSDVGNPAGRAGNIQGVTPNGNSSPSASIQDSSAQGRDTANRMTLMDKAVSVRLTRTNTASAISLGDASTVFTAQDQSTTEYTFDTFGRPERIKLQGISSLPQVTQFRYWPNGLLKEVIYPEGNSVEYTYDSLTPNLRSQANLTGVTRRPNTRGGTILSSSHRYHDLYNLPSGTQLDFNRNETSISLTDGNRSMGSVTKGNETEIFHYNSFGQLESHTTAQGITTSLGYFSSNGFLEFRRLPNLTTRWTYSGNAGQRGMPDRVLDPAGIATDFRYDELDRVISVERGLARQSFAYDSTGGIKRRITGVEAGRNLVERIDRDGFGFARASHVENVEVNGLQRQTLTTTYERDDFYRVKATTDPGGVRNEVDFDFAGRPTNIRVPGAYEESFGYDLNGNLTMKQVGSATNTYSYDGHDRLSKSLAPNGAETTIQYDSNNNPTNLYVLDSTDGNRLLMQAGSAYDPLDRPVSISQATAVGDSTHTIQYLSSQRQVVFTDPINSQTTVSIDNVGRLQQVQAPNATLAYAYDVPGRVINTTLTDATGPSVETYHYDTLGYLDQYKDAREQQYDLARGFDGRLLSMTTPEAQIYQNTHTILGEPSSMSRPDGQTLTAKYDERRELTSLAPTPGAGMSFGYDSSGRMTNALAADNKGAKHRSFNEFMQPILTDLPRGLVVSNAYDLTGRLVRREIAGLQPAPRVDAWSYDALDRVKSASNPFGVVSNTYDLQGYARQIEFRQLGTNWILKQTADLVGARTNLTYPDGLAINLARDADSRLEKILPAGVEPVIRSSTYATPSQVGTRVLGNNAITADFLYDPDRRPLVRRFRRTSDSKVLAEVRYAYNGSGMQTARQFIHRGGRADLFTYDGSHKVRRADIGARPPVTGELPRSVTGFHTSGWAAGLYARDYGYTGSEVLSGAPFYNPDSLLVPSFATNFAVPDVTLHVPQIDEVNRTRDDAGNVTSGRVWVRIPGNPIPQPVLATFVYNELNQLTRVQRADGVVAENTFGPSGLRIQRRVTGSTTLCVPSNYEYLYEGINLIEIRDLDQPAHPLRSRFYYGDNGDELVAGDLWDSGSGQLRRCYYLTDALGSVMALADAAGNVTERYDYDTWGEVTVLAPDTAAPRVSRVTRDGNDLVIEFTEPVLPAMMANNGSQLVQSLRNPADAFQVLSKGVALPGQFRFEERSAGRAFGTTFRYIPVNPLPNGLELAVNAGLFADDAGNPNPQEQFTLANGTNAYAGPVVGSTAPVALARSQMISPFMFQGQIYDPDAGLIYMRARFYDTALGGFLQRDPYGYEDSVNEYAAFSNNSINRRDPTGTSPTASDIADWWDKQKKDTERTLEDWVQDDGGIASVAAATLLQSAMDVGQSEVDLLRLGAGAGEGGASGVLEDAVRLLQVPGVGSILGKGVPAVKGLLPARVQTALANPVVQSGVASKRLSSAKTPQVTVPKTSVAAKTTSPIKNLTEQAADLVPLNRGRNRVTLRSPSKKMEVDLAGNSHGGVPTPHTKVSPLNPQAPKQPTYNTRNSPVKQATQQDIRTVRRYLERQN